MTEYFLLIGELWIYLKQKLVTTFYSYCITPIYCQLIFYYLVVVMLISMLKTLIPTKNE